MTDGISLRDYFAGQAMLALLSDSESTVTVTPEGKIYSRAVARVAYEYADAMMKERLKP